jgi:5'-nucleotidase
MDGVVAHWEEGLVSALRLKHPEITPVSLEARKHFKASEDYPEEHRERVLNLVREPGFYRELPPIPGALEALEEMATLGLDIIFLTAPMSDHPTCSQEKVAWVERHLGRPWVNRLFIAKDKTRVRATYLVDDRPEVTGLMRPTWEHLLFTAPYNQNVQGKRRFTWETWRSFI